jgi:hypothetical protein
MFFGRKYWMETNWLLKDVFNLTIEGIGEEPSQILIEPRYAYVLSFINAENIKINNIKAVTQRKDLFRWSLQIYKLCRY